MGVCDGIITLLNKHFFFFGNRLVGFLAEDGMDGKGMSARWAWMMECMGMAMERVKSHIPR